MNDILLYDSLSNQKKTFEPIDINNIRIYACGPTVYNFAHIGNARMAIVFDNRELCSEHKCPCVIILVSLGHIRKASPSAKVVITTAALFHWKPWAHSMLYSASSRRLMI